MPDCAGRLGPARTRAAARPAGPPAPAAPPRRSRRSCRAPAAGWTLSRTTTSVVIESTRLRAVARLTSVTSASQAEDSRGREQRHRQHRQRPAVHGSGRPAAACRRSAAPPARRSHTPGRSPPAPPAPPPGSAPRRPARSAGCGCCTQRGVIISRQVVDQLPGDLPGDAAVPDHHRRAQHRDRHAGLAEQPLHRAPGTQVRRQPLVVGAQAAEVDDPLDAGLGGRRAERPGGRRVDLFEAGRIQRMHKIVGRPDAGQRRRQAGRRVHVAGHRLAGPAVVVRVPGHRPHPVARPTPARGTGASR